MWFKRQRNIWCSSWQINTGWCVNLSSNKFVADISGLCFSVCGCHGNKVKVSCSVSKHPFSFDTLLVSLLTWRLDWYLICLHCFRHWLWSPLTVSCFQCKASRNHIQTWQNGWNTQENPIDKFQIVSYISSSKHFFKNMSYTGVVSTLSSVCLYPEKQTVLGMSLKWYPMEYWEKYLLTGEETNRFLAQTIICLQVYGHIESWE